MILKVCTFSRNGKHKELIKPYATCKNSHPTIHTLFPETLLLKRAKDDRGFLDLAFVTQRSPWRVKGSDWNSDSRKEQEESFHQHRHELSGLIEFKQDIETDFGSDVVRIKKWLRRFPDAWGIMAVMYSWANTRSEVATNSLRTLTELRNDSSKWSRFEFITEYSSKNQPWNPKVLLKDRFLKRLENDR